MLTSAVTPDDSIDVRAADGVARRHAPYLLFILLVSVLALLVLAADMFVTAESDTGRILHYADTLLCTLFFGDFLICLSALEQPRKIFRDLGMARFDFERSDDWRVALGAGLAVRRRVLRVLRGVRSARILMRFILEKRAQSIGLAAALASIVVVAVSSIAILHLESAAGAEANIRSADDALWWSLVTITTVGYGDRYPVTLEGRCVAIALMVIGVGLIGTWSGIAASWFLAAADERRQDSADLLRQDIQELRQLVEQRLQI